MNRTTNLLTVRIQSVSKYPDVDLKKKKKKKTQQGSEHTYIDMREFALVHMFFFLKMDFQGVKL